MSNFPVMLAVICREETISNAISDLFQCAAHRFAETSLVTDFVEQFS